MDEEAQAAAAAAAEAEAAAAAAAAAKTTEQQAQVPTAEEIAQLRADLDAARAEAAKFAGIDPAKAKGDAKKVADAEAAARAAEAAQAQAEGNFERLRELQAEDAAASIAAALAERDEARATAAAASQDAAAARRQAAFATSQFFAKETIFAPQKAERLYGDHVEIENGNAVVYDAPRGAAKRAIVMDARGKPLGFDDAMKKVIEADPDKDTFLRSKIQPGGGSKTVDGKVENAGGDRLTRISAGLKALRNQ